MALLHAERRHRAFRINQGTRESVLWAQESCCLCGGILGKDPRKSCSSRYISTSPLSNWASATKKKKKKKEKEKKGNDKADLALSKGNPFINIFT